MVKLPSLVSILVKFVIPLSPSIHSVCIQLFKRSDWYVFTARPSCVVFDGFSDKRPCGFGAAECIVTDSAPAAKIISLHWSMLVNGNDSNVGGTVTGVFPIQ